MIKALLIFIVTLLPMLAQGAVVTGTVLAGAGMSITPAVGAEVLLRIGRGPDEYPTTLTNEDGMFMITVDELPGQLHMIFTLEGYVSEQRAFTPGAEETFKTGTILLGLLVRSTISLHAEIIDSVADTLLSGVVVRFRHRPVNGEVFMEAVADADGYLEVEVPVSNASDGKAYWDIQHPGFEHSIRQLTASMTASLHTIELIPGSDNLLLVAGTLIDSVTRQPVAGGKVVLTTTYHDAVFDTLKTGIDGTFSIAIPISGVSSAIPELFCVVTAPFYCSTMVCISLPAESENIDIGEVVVAPGTVRLVQPAPAAMHQASAVVPLQTVTLNGRVVHRKLPHALLLVVGQKKTFFSGHRRVYYQK